MICKVRFLADCGKLSNPLNGSVTLPDGRAIGMWAYYECISDFFKLIGTPKRQCLRRKTWSGEAPVCQLKGTRLIKNIDIIFKETYKFKRW